MMTKGEIENSHKEVSALMQSGYYKEFSALMQSGYYKEFLSLFGNRGVDELEDVKDYLTAAAISDWLLDHNYPQIATNWFNFAEKLKRNAENA